MVELFLGIMGVYFLFGIVFTVPFLLRGARTIDPAAVEGSWGFKVMIGPGVILFWPYLMTRWLKKKHPPEEKSAHRRSQA